jgi:predicted nucleic acid-binding protein
MEIAVRPSSVMKYLYVLPIFLMRPCDHSPPTPAVRALDQIAAWLESPTLVLLGEGKGYFETLKEVVQKGKVTGPRVHDARIAALCKNHGVTELFSADRDFNRFSMIRVKNPLIG